MREIEIKIREFLLELAKNGTTTTYTNINEKFNLNLDFKDESKRDRAVIGGTLENILRFENRKKRPFLTIIVIGKKEDERYKECLPSDRFYKIIRSFRRFKEDLSKRNELEIFKEQSTKLFDFWSDPKNYEKYKDFK